MKYYDVNGTEISKEVFTSIKDNDIMLYGKAYITKTPDSLKLLNAYDVMKGKW